MVMVRGPDDPRPGRDMPGQPQWMDAAFMNQLLRDQLKVTSMSVEDAVAAGENYSSNVKKVKVETTVGTVSLFVKSIPQSEFRVKFMVEMEVFKREITMYTKTLPLIKGLYAKPNFPACIYSELNNKTDTLILRDMVTDGFMTRPRQLGLDAAHCRVALSELAHLHGHSIAIRIQEPETFENQIRKVYADKMYDEANRANSAPFFQSILVGIGESICINLPLRFRAIGEMIKGKLALKAFDMIKDHIQVPNDPAELSKTILCLNHGDFWSNNMLFKYDENEEPVACTMVDFQMSRCSSPVLDLLYFFFTSTTQAIRREHMLSLLQFYMDEVRAAITLRGVSDPGHFFYKDLSELHMDLLKRKELGFVMACIVIPAVVADMEQVPENLEDLTEKIFEKMDASPFAKMYSGPLFQLRFKELIEDYDDMGFFLKQAK